MTTQTSSKVPQIRFKGFEGSWDKRMLGDEPGEIIAGGDVDKHKLCDRGKYPVLANALQNHGIHGFYESDFRVKAPAVTVTGRGDVGHAAVRVANFTPVVRLLSVKNSHNVYFLKESINNHRVLVESTGVPQLTVPQLSKYQICFPGTIREENKIGEYFREQDSLIGLHQRKHDKLVTLKKAMLQKMFPQAGATTPEIRFKGFEGDWVEKKLGELMPITSAARVHKHEWTRAGVPFFRTSDVVSLYKGEKNAMAFISLDLYEKLSEKIGRIKRGDILITGGGSIGIPFLAISNDPLYFKDADLLWLKVPKIIDSIYLYTFFSSDLFRKYLGSISHIGTIGHYTVEQAKKTPITIPLQAEQEKIGTYFRQLDALIAQHAIQLQKLQQIKSACLEKMFV